ncbi:type II secretion system F family protein [Cysteiniphilum halobium]
MNQTNKFQQLLIKLEFTSKKQIEYLEMVIEMMSYGMSLKQIFEELMPSVFKKGIVAKLNKKIAESLKHGLSISGCFQVFFSKNIVYLIEIGERTGQLTTGFENALALLKRKKQSIIPALSSLLYPSIVFIASSVLFVYYKTIIDKLLNSFQGKEPPQATHYFINIAYFYTHYLPVFIVIMIVLFVLLRLLLPNYTGRLRQYLDKLPILHLYSKFQGAYWLQNLGVFLSSGVMLGQALDYISSTNKGYIRAHCELAKKQLARGITNFGAVLNTGMVQSYYIQILSIAFETNTLIIQLPKIGSNIFEHSVKKIAICSKYFGYLLLGLGAFNIAFSMYTMYTTATSLSS